MDLHDLIPTSHDAMPLVRWLFWSTAASVLLRSLAKGFGPMVLAYSPGLHRFLAFLGTGILTLIADAQGLVETMRPKDAPKPPVPPLPILMALAACLAGCPHLPEKSGCRPNSMRCHEGRPQVCSGSTRWVNADRPCSEVGATCCLTQYPQSEVFVWACVPQDRCVPDPQADAGVEQ